MKETADKLAYAIDDLLLHSPRKTLVVEGEIQELLCVAQLRHDAGRTFAAIGASRQEQGWRHLRATLKVR